MMSFVMWLLSELFWPYCILVAICFIYIKFASVNTFIKSGAKQNVLFVTAHPDDECMFFSPSVLSTFREGHRVYLVCLSKGDYEGLGDTRKKELIASCVRLGIMQSRVTIVDDEQFKDGPDTNWDVDALGEQILRVVKRVSADSVITFDKHGVSGHANHIAIYNAINKLYRNQQLDKVSVFTLQTTNLFRKYFSFLDIPLSSIFCMTSFVNLPSEVLKSWQAMAAHDSQMVWFRKLYIVFSRYMYVNTLQEMK